MERPTGVAGEYLILKETARTVKEKGFNLIHSDFYIDRAANDGYTDLPCVPQTLVQQWLREKHNLHVLPYIMTALGLKDYSFTIVRPREKGTLGCDEIMTRENSCLRFERYEEALEKGIQEALKLI
jgi:hypothetical protein